MRLNQEAAKLLYWLKSESLFLPCKQNGLVGVVEEGRGGEGRVRVRGLSSAHIGRDGRMGGRPRGGICVRLP